MGGFDFGISTIIITSLTHHVVTKRLKYLFWGAKNTKLRGFYYKELYKGQILDEYIYFFNYLAVVMLMDVLIDGSMVKGSMEERIEEVIYDIQQ